MYRPNSQMHVLQYFAMKPKVFILFFLFLLKGSLKLKV